MLPKITVQKEKKWKKRWDDECQLSTAIIESGIAYFERMHNIADGAETKARGHILIPQCFFSVTKQQNLKRKRY